MIIPKSTTLKEQAYHSIRDVIMKREVRRDRIYSEQWFADNFCISRTPVREALLQLRSEGLIDVLPNRGVIIRNLTMEDARHVFQMRSAIEGYCSSYLAERHREPEAIQSLERIKDALERCVRNFEIADELTIHVEAIRYVNNPLFVNQFNQMRAKIEVFWSDVVSAPNRRDEVYMEHRKIFDSMASGDALGAYSASVEHSRITLLRIQNRANFPPPAELKPVDHLLND